MPSKLTDFKTYFSDIVAGNPAFGSFVFGHIERAIEGTHNTLTYPLFHLHPPVFKAVDNSSNYFAVRACGTFVVWVLGDTDDLTSQDAAWDLSLELSMSVLKQMQHDCLDGKIDEFDQNQSEMQMVQPLWVDRGHGWEVYFEFQLPANEDLC